MTSPDFAIESSLTGLIAGVDEAGRGPLAGPVVAAAVILDPRRLPEGIDDSKKLSAAKREALYQSICDQAARYGIGIASVAEIDTINILQATKLAMCRAVEQLQPRPDIALVDGNQPPALACRVQTIVGGDGLSLSIAAASILAKVTRDRLMCALAEECPGYGWERNAGYGTRTHLEALAKLGVTAHHRRSFAPVRSILLQRQQERAA